MSPSRRRGLDLPDYQPGVLDTTPIASEPVKKFGANSQAVYAE